MVFGKITEALQRVDKREEKESDITVILNAYRRPYNLAGQIVLSKNIENTNQFIDISALTSGYYVYEISTVGYRVVRDKLVVLPY